MLTAFIVIIIFFLSVQVFPVAIGINITGKLGKAIILIVILSLMQVVTYWLGLKLGSSFMHLMDGFKSAVFFIGFLLIGIRMLMETINIHKGERTYSINSMGHVLLASIAQGINAFLAGLLFNYLLIDEKFTLILLTILTIVIATTGIIMKPGKFALSLASLVYALGGLVMIVFAIYISFFIL